MHFLLEYQASRSKLLEAKVSEQVRWRHEVRSAMMTNRNAFRKVPETLSTYLPLVLFHIVIFFVHLPAKHQSHAIIEHMTSMADTALSTDAPDAPNAIVDPDAITLNISHHGAQHTFTFAQDATIGDLSSRIESDLKVPQANQKLMIAKLGLLKPPFKNPALPISDLLSKKITLMGSTAFEVKTLAHTAAQAASVPARPQPKIPAVKAYKTHDWKREAEDAQYTFTTLRPLSYLPNPSRSLAFLQRLKDDVGIKSAMRKHKFTVPLLTEMNPAEHTQSDHEGTSRTLGLNRNAGQVIELRLRTDAYDGYRDYKTIRKTLCHELAHNVHGPHDRNFWELCKQIEREVEGADYNKSGRSLGENHEYYGAGADHDEDVDDHGGWTGGDFVLGSGDAGSAAGPSSASGSSMRDVLARAAEERMRRQRDQNGDNGGQGGGS